MAKTIIIGGSRGIGLSILDLLKEEECINLSRSKQTPLHHNHKHIKFDITNSEFPEIENIKTLIYCPGTINLKPFGSLKEEDFINDLQINFLGAVKAIKHYFRTMKKQENASIVLFSTVAVSQGMPFHASIASAKGAIEGLTRSLAAEFAPKIRVNCIAPTLTNTPLAATILRNDEALERSNNRHPLKKINSPEDVSSMVNYLISENAKNITGQIFHIDGGLSTLKL
jgi:NAD(P)-dependent dehydrogenase (short-subunit alcohol dehydrogenase family)